MCVQFCWLLSCKKLARPQCSTLLQVQPRRIEQSEKLIKRLRTKIRKLDSDYDELKSVKFIGVEFDPETYQKGESEINSFLDQGFRVIIAGAGGAAHLPGMIASLTTLPVIGVPISVGYGVSSGGVAALNGMLSSCSPGLTVVNIDNGYGAAMAALRVIRNS